MAFLHGPESFEQQSGPPTINVADDGVIVVIGTAPLALNGRTANTGLINVPIACLTATDDAQFGVDRPDFTIPSALADMRAQATATKSPIIIVINVNDESTAITAVAAETYIPTTGNPDWTAYAKGDKVVLAHVPYSGVVIKNMVNDPDEGLTIVTFIHGTDYTVDDYGNIVIVNAAKFNELTAADEVSETVKGQLNCAYNWFDTSAITAGTIIGSIDGDTEARTGMQLIPLCEQLAGYEPTIIEAPGYNTLTAVVSEIRIQCTALGAVSFIDAPVGATLAQVITSRGTVGDSFDVADEQIIPVYPMMKKYDKSTNDDKLTPFSNHWAGITACTPYWISPSSKQIQNITGVERPILCKLGDPNSEANQLNANGVGTVYSDADSGIQTWGNHSSAFPGSGLITTFICVRRTANIIEKAIKKAAKQFIDDPLNPALRDSVVEAVNSFLRTQVGIGALIGGNCWFPTDDATNPLSQLAAGHLTFAYDFVSPPPAERITFIPIINTGYLTVLIKK